jgi:rare lipoprotein A
VRAKAKASRSSSTSSRSTVTGTGWRSARCSWYGPGFYGNTMAGGGKLTKTSMVVAHKSLPFGTKIQFSYKGRTCTAVVQDRGPYVGGREFDLGPGTARALGFSGVGTVQYRILGR